jgi:hypothetical protein
MRRSVRPRDARLLALPCAAAALAFAACGEGASSGGNGAPGGAGGNGASAGAPALGGQGVGATSGTTGASAGHGTSGASSGTAGASTAGTPGSGGASAGAAGTVSSGGVGALGDAAGTPSAAGAGAVGGSAGANAGGEGGEAGGGEPRTVEELTIGNAWSGHPVFFALVTHGTRQYAAYYDADRNMSVASRTLGEPAFTSVDLPSVLGWDSHNYVAMAVDSADHVHVVGNMHSSPLVYFRTSTAADTSSFQKLAMVGSNEQLTTYPIFFTGPTGDLVFEYRDGESGNGNTIFNAYDTGDQTWTRLLNSALLDGEDQRNAYPEGPVLGPDGYFHLVWVWRDTADASTNHDLSYARSQDLKAWQAGDGTPVTLPITLAKSDVVDPVPVNGGMINNNTRVGFDLDARPVVSYHKFDGAGNTQLYAARLESGAWAVHQMTDWDERWSFGGGGTLVFQIQLDDGIHELPDGRLVQDVYNAKLGGNVTLVLDPETLHAIETINPALTPYPSELGTPVSSVSGMHVRWASDGGKGPDASVRYMLRWETLDANGDQPRNPIPDPTPLKLYAFKQ